MPRVRIEQIPVLGRYVLIISFNMKVAHVACQSRSWFVTSARSRG